MKRVGKPGQQTAKHPQRSHDLRLAAAGKTYEGGAREGRGDGRDLQGSDALLKMRRENTATQAGAVYSSTAATAAPLWRTEYW